MARKNFVYLTYIAIPEKSLPNTRKVHLKEQLPLVKLQTKCLKLF